MSEKWDLVYRDRTPSGMSAERGSAIPDGMYHKTVSAWIRNSHSRWLITRRADCISRGGLWEFPGGSVMSGENSYAALVREVREETGLDVVTATVFTYVIIEEKHVMTDVWVVKQDAEISSLKLDPKEVSEARWATSDEIRELMEKGEFIPMYGLTYWNDLMRVYDTPVCVDF